MSQISKKLQIVGQPAVNAGAWTAIVNPVSECRRVVVFNPDVASELSLATDAADPFSVQTIAAGANVAMELSAAYVKGFAYGETVCYLMGGGASPLVHFTV